MIFVSSFNTTFRRQHNIHAFPFRPDSTGAATTPVDFLFSPSSVAAEQGSQHGASLLSPVTAGQAQSPIAYSLPASPLSSSLALDQERGRISISAEKRQLWSQRGNGSGQGNANGSRSGGSGNGNGTERNLRASSPDARRPPSVQAQALRLSEQMRLDLERGHLISLSSPDGDLVPVRDTRSPFRDSRPSPSVSVPRSNPASPSKLRPYSPLRSPFSSLISPLRAGKM
jgi:hypothetical protein